MFRLIPLGLLEHLTLPFLGIAQFSEIMFKTFRVFVVSLPRSKSRPGTFLGAGTEGHLLFWYKPKHSGHSSCEGRGSNLGNPSRMQKGYATST